MASCLLQTAAAALAYDVAQRPPGVHGQVSISGPVDGTAQVVDPGSHTVNIVGFEHVAVSAAAGLLGSGSGLFTLPDDAPRRARKTALHTPPWDTTDGVPGQPGSHAGHEVRFACRCRSPDHLAWPEPSLLDRLCNVVQARLSFATARAAPRAPTTPPGWSTAS